MRYVTLPHTDLTVSQIALGTAALGSVTDRAESFAMLDAFVAAGGTFLDTAHVYANWVPGTRSSSEKTLGDWLGSRGHHDDVIVATKGCHEEIDRPEVPRVTPEILVADLDESLQFLGMERIDLYWLHRDDRTQPVGPLIETLNAQVAAGKIRHFGCSNWEPDRIEAAHRYAAEHGLRSFIASQILWSLAEPNPGAVTPVHALLTEQSRPFYQTAGMGVVAFTAQARGYFSKAAAGGGVEALSEDLRAAFDNERSQARLARVQEVAFRLGTTVTAVVLSYLTSQPIVTVPVIGPKTLTQLQDSLRDADLRLDPAMLRYLEDGTREEEGAEA